MFLRPPSAAWTVNLASRLALVAQAGEVVVSEEVAKRSESVRFQEGLQCG
jgi:hypothetical protein